MRQFFINQVHIFLIIYLQRSHKEAPILVAAPHSTIIDIIAAFHSHSSCVAKDEIKKIPLFSSMARFGQVGLELNIHC